MLRAFFIPVNTKHLREKMHPFAPTGPIKESADTENGTT
jgi:hypothetical protein